MQTSSERIGVPWCIIALRAATCLRFSRSNSGSLDFKRCQSIFWLDALSYLSGIDTMVCLRRIRHSIQTQLGHLWREYEAHQNTICRLLGNLGVILKSVEFC